jgi:hypothetical protein
MDGTILLPASMAAAHDVALEVLAPRASGSELR